MHSLSFIKNQCSFFSCHCVLIQSTHSEAGMLLYKQLIIEQHEKGVETVTVLRLAYEGNVPQIVLRRESNPYISTEIIRSPELIREEHPVAKFTIRYWSITNWAWVIDC